MDHTASNGCGLLLLMFLAISVFLGLLTVFAVQGDAVVIEGLPAPMAPPAEVAVAAAPETILTLAARRPGDPNLEAAEIANFGPAVDLTGWQLIDAGGNVYTFPTYTLIEGAVVRVATRSGTATPTLLYWGRSAAVWSPGETMTLKDADGLVRAVATVGAAP